MEATDDYRHIRVAFYVALTNDACKRVALLRAIKKLLPDVGIIRVKSDGYCRFYLRVNGKKDMEIAKPRIVTVKLVRRSSSSQY